MSDFGRVVRKGVLWILMGRGVVFVITLGTSIVLARLLEPQDFGIYGISQIFTGLTTRFGNLGFGSALVQRKEIHDDHISSLFVFNLLLFSSFSGLLILSSPLVGVVFENALAGRVLALMALMFLASPFSSVARVIMQRDMNFKGPAFANMIDHFSSAAIAILFAFLGYGVWSLVYGHILGTTLKTLTLVIQAKWRPRLIYKHKAMKDLFSFGIHMFMKRLLIYGSDKADYLIIGKRLGVASLGLYEKAFNLMEIAVKELSVKIGPVLFSAFSKLQEDRARLLAAYHKVIFGISLVACPIFFGLFMIAPVFIHVLFGEKWMPSVIPLQIMCIAGLMRLYLRVTSSVINAMGEIAGDVQRRVVTFILLVIGCWYGSTWGIVGVSLSVTIVTCILMISMITYLGHLTGLTWIDFFRPQRLAFFTSALMAGIVFFYQKGMEEVLGTYSIAMLFSSVIVGMISYVSVIWLLKPADVVSLINDFVTDFKPGRS
ncbi:MAG: lipopolysaccharide biosynthesis protein [Waddliaceae bacterium]